MTEKPKPTPPPDPEALAEARLIIAALIADIRAFRAEAAKAAKQAA